VLEQPQPPHTQTKRAICQELLLQPQEARLAQQKQRQQTGRTDLLRQAGQRQPAA